MNEFDQCPGCREDLLLEDPDSQGKGLRCLGCGYTCLAAETSDDSADLAAGKESEKRAYWKRRCEAAENVIESINTKNEEMYLISSQTWIEIKEEGEPA